VQRAPQLLSYLQEFLDASDARGRYILTGSNNLLLMERITQTLAGRAGYLDILPFSLAECLKGRSGAALEELVLDGQYPEVITGAISPARWHTAYMRTYVEGDVRQLKNITDLLLFRRFMLLCAGRIGQQVNYSA